MKKTNTLVLLFNLALLTTGAFAQPITLTTPMGPRPAELAAADYVGTLKVFSATEAVPDGKDAYRYPHTSYEIYKADGTRVRKVNNGRTLQIETPTAVTLPRGRYVIQAQAETAGLIRIPVIIATGRTTTLHLEGPQDWQPGVTAEGALVRLPNGQPIGYQAR